ncbi:hypothetical protein SCP_0111200 [Sparassis crispa]|uniref:F-box domain-containing protein n=1 Tax=Sparassis crispa TaxID=139825 RepID=A0A401G7V1_9APHY|nr:hypothetical protein SCP_0111200 [Sparassis crispa]GBE78237.1 hypothetical protein SCP_0111200 [Sparassis crispa]
MPTVPPELSDYIVDFLHNDYPSLKACCLASRDWLATARYHLFESVTLHNPRLCEAFKQLMERSPTIGSFVQEINISRLIGPGTTTYTGAERHLLEQSLSSIFVCLDHVKTLSVAMLDISATIQSGLVNRPSVTELVLQYCTLPAFQDFIQLFHCYPLLESLNLHGVTWKSKSFRPLSRSTSVHLRKLVVGRDVDTTTLLEWMLAESIHGSIESLSICCTSERDAVVVAPLLEILGPQLAHLDLHWNLPAAKSIRLPPVLSVERCTSLRELSLYCAVPYDCTLLWLTALLSGLRAAHLEVIVVNLRVLGNLEAIDWEAAEKILSEITSLRSLLFRIKLWVGVYANRLEVETSIRGSLSHLDSKGLLSFAS